MSESGDAWAALTTFAATDDARQQDGHGQVVPVTSTAAVEAMVAAEAVAAAAVVAAAAAEAAAEAAAKAKAKANVKAKVEAEAVCGTSRVRAAPDVQTDQVTDSTSCNGPHVSPGEHATGWTDFRGLVTNLRLNPGCTDAAQARRSH